MLFNYQRIVLFCAMVAHLAIIAQEVEVIDKKGSLFSLNQNNVTTASVAPTGQVENDVWFDTSDIESTRPKIWDGSTWQPLEFTGTAGSIFFAGSGGSPTQDNTQLHWNSTNDRLGVGTNTPDAKLDVKGGTVRFSDYGTNAITGTAAYLLGVEADGDIIEVANPGSATDDQTASEVDITDSAGNFAASNVEGALAELASATEDQNASEVDITDSASNFTSGNVEGALAELASDNQKAYGEIRLGSDYIRGKDQIGSGVIPLDNASPVNLNTTINTSNHYIQVSIAGIYRVTYSSTVYWTESDHTVEFFITLNGTANSNAIDHTETSMGGKNKIYVNTSRSVLLDLNANDRLYLKFRFYEDAGLIFYSGGTSLNVELID